jgi:outer membrane biosynthesis protein TonB
MREGNYLRAFLLCLVLTIVSSVTYAKELVKINTLNQFMLNELSSVDSLLRGRQQDDKGSKKKTEKDAKNEPEAEKGKQPKPEPIVDIDPKRPDIKEVPRARPKLRPGVVDKVKIKRPPVRVKPGKGLRINL